MEIVTVEEMRRIDRYAIRSLKIPSLVLMEAAGLRIVEALQRRFSDLRRRRILVLCGRGNNGGDGLVVARHLHCLGHEPLVVLAAEPRDLSPDARTNLRAARRSGVSIEIASSPASWRAFRRRHPDRDLVVDALLGTGLVGPVRGLAARIILDVEALGLPVLAVDLPSGLAGDTGEVLGPALTAAVTVALCRPKLAHVLPPACLRTGTLEVAEIGIPQRAVDAAKARTFWIEPEDFGGFLPPRPRDAHKGSFGHALIVAGSVGKAGAAGLASRAALRIGAGLATVAAPAAVRPEIASFNPEVMTAAFPVPSSLAPAAVKAAVDRLLAETSGKSAVAAGPGLGREPAVAETIRRFVASCPLPLVLDADALNAFEGRAASLSGRRRPLILTPHPGEMARILGSATRIVLRDRLGAARALARAARAIVVLKGMATLVAAPDGRVFVNRTGNPGMATAGSGDVLTGILAGLLARGLDPLRTVLFGVLVHGRAGDLAAQRRGQEGMIAGDIIEHLPAALGEYAG